MNRTLTALLRVDRADPPAPAAPSRQRTTAHHAATDAYTAQLDRVRGAVARALGGLVVIVATLAFVASFDKISLYAVNELDWPERLRWVPPLLVDSFILTGTMLVLWLALAGRRLRRTWAAWYGWGLVALGTAASTIINVSDAGKGLPGWIVAGGPPIALFLAVEVLVILVRHTFADYATHRTHPAPATPTAKPVSTAPTVDAASAPRAHLTRIDPPGEPASTAPRAHLESSPGVPALDPPVVLEGPAAHAAEDRAAHQRTTPQSSTYTTDGETQRGAVRDRVIAAWQHREVRGGQHLTGTALARELGIDNHRYVQALLRELRAAHTAPDEGSDDDDATV